MSGGSLGASCGPLHTCCVTPSSQDIQPKYWGPVINDPREYSLWFFASNISNNSIYFVLFFFDRKKFISKNVVKVRLESAESLAAPMHLLDNFLGR